MTLKSGYIEQSPINVGLETLGWGYLNERVNTGAPSPGNFDGAKTVAYHPIWINTVYPVRYLWFMSGNGVNAKNEKVEIAIYTNSSYKPNKKIVSTGQVPCCTHPTTALAVFLPVLTTKILVPNLYWLAIWFNVTNVSVGRSSLASSQDDSVKFIQANQDFCPDTATPAISTTSSIYNIGLSRSTRNLEFL